MTIRPERPGSPLAAACLAALASLGCATGREAVEAAPRVGPAKAAAIASGYSGGTLEFRRAEWDEAVQQFGRVLAFNPRDDVATYLTAVARARSGQADAALEWLQRLWQIDSCLLPVPSSFERIESDQRFKDVSALIRARAAKTHRSRVAFTLAERDLVPQGLAWDERDRVFFVSSIRKRKIVKVKPRVEGGPADCEDFVAPGADGIDSILGLRVDPVRRQLWALSSVQPGRPELQGHPFGTAALLRYGLDTGRLEARFDVPVEAHLFNDLAVDGKGNVYVTDILTGAVFVLHAGDVALRVLAAPGAFIAPAGIVVSEDGRRLYVSDVARGVFRLDPENGSSEVLDQPPGLWPVGLEGLALHRDQLVGIMGSISVGRVARWRLAPDGRALDGGEVLECGHPSFHLPTTGVFAGESFFYIANSQYDAAGPGRDPAPDALEPIVILELPLGSPPGKAP